MQQVNPCHMFRFKDTYWIFILTWVLSRVQVQGDILDIYTYISPITCSGSGRHIGYLYLHESFHVFRFKETYWIIILTWVLSRVEVLGDILDIYTYISPVTCSGSGRHIGYLYLHESCHVFRFKETYWIIILTWVLSRVQVQGGILDSMFSH